WTTLTPHAKRLTRYIVGHPGEPVAGEGFHHPRRAVRDERVATDLARLGEPAASDYLQRF
ncbi:MAG: hypothetical protein OEW83_22470, partial [Acidimicrobiia bacterium]|nr:hypothetical protein [Acidimicrobiia bacterium]